MSLIGIKFVQATYTVTLPLEPMALLAVTTDLCILSFRVIFVLEKEVIYMYDGFYRNILILHVHVISESEDYGSFLLEIISRSSRLAVLSIPSMCAWSIISTKCCQI